MQTMRGAVEDSKGDALLRDATGQEDVEEESKGSTDPEGTAPGSQQPHTPAQAPVTGKVPTPQAAPSPQAIPPTLDEDIMAAQAELQDAFDDIGADEEALAGEMWAEDF